MASKNSVLDSLVDEIRLAKLPPCRVRRAIRERARVGLREAAQVLGVHHMTLWRWENDPDVNPKREHAIAYGIFLEALEQAAG